MWQNELRNLHLLALASLSSFASSTDRFMTRRIWAAEDSLAVVAKADQVPEDLLAPSKVVAKAMVVAKARVVAKVEQVDSVSSKAAPLGALVDSFSPPEDWLPVQEP